MPEARVSDMELAIRYSGVKVCLDKNALYGTIIHINGHIRHIMKRQEKHFSSPASAALAVTLGAAFRAARVARARTRAEAATRARLSPRTVARIESGDVSVSLGGWLAYVESLGLLELFAPVANPASDAQGEALRRLAAPKQPRKSKNTAERYDF